MFSSSNGGELQAGAGAGRGGGNSQPLKSPSLPKLGEKLPVGGREGWEWQGRERGIRPGWERLAAPCAWSVPRAGVQALAILNSSFLFLLFLLHHFLPLGAVS